MKFVKSVAALALLALAGCFPFEERAYSPAITPVTPEDVSGMTRAGYSDAMILDMVRGNGVQRKASADDIVAMKDAGTSDPVVSAVLAAPVTVARPATEIRHVHPYDPWYWPSTSVSYGIGFSYGYWGGGYRRCR